MQVARGEDDQEWDTIPAFMRGQSKGYPVIKIGKRDKQTTQRIKLRKKGWHRSVLPFPETTLPRRTHRTQKSCYVSMVYYSERIQIKPAKEKRVSVETRHNF